GGIARGAQRRALDGRGRIVPARDERRPNVARCGHHVDRRVPPPPAAHAREDLVAPARPPAMGRRAPSGAPRHLHRPSRALRRHATRRDASDGVSKARIDVPRLRGRGSEHRYRAARNRGGEMMSESHTAEWYELQKRLAALAEAAHAHNAYVLDAWENLWCAAHSIPDLHGTSPDLRRGHLRPPWRSSLTSTEPLEV